MNLFKPNNMPKESKYNIEARNYDYNNDLIICNLLTIPLVFLDKDNKKYYV